MRSGLLRQRPKEADVGDGARERGRELRGAVQRSSHGEWATPVDRPDPVATVLAQDRTRLPFLVPVRHTRMAQSELAFYRGAAAIMAADLARTPVTGLDAQICGDAHLSNFGVYGSPERDLVFDVNDFDETSPGPWEWDVKRLVASFAIAARHNAYPDDQQRELPRLAAAAYREAVRAFASAAYTDVWYAHLDVEQIADAFRDQLTAKERRRGERFVRRTRSATSLRAFDALVERGPDGYRIAAQPPLLVPVRDLSASQGRDALVEAVHAELEAYLASVPDHIAVLLRRYRYLDAALKAVGVGSVGTRCFVVLLEGRDEHDPLFLQVKEAGRSVLEDHLPPGPYRHHGRRVVEGQRLMQAVSDSFLGWNEGTAGTHYYWRQLKDMKGSFEVEGVAPEALARYARLCGWTLARAHARSGDVDAIAGYLGSGNAFDAAMARFASAYAEQNAADFAAFTEAIASGRVDAGA